MLEKIKDIAEKQQNEWTAVIKPKRGWLDINFKEIWQYRDLIKIFVYRDFVVYYKQTILGPLWWVIQPLFTSGMFTLIFSAIAGISTDGLPPILFYLSGTVCWSYFSESVLNTANTFVTNRDIFGKVYFPRLVIPVATVFSNIIKFIIQFSMFLAIYLIYFFKGAIPWPNLTLLLLLPLLLAQMAMLGLGIGIIASSLTTKYRDLSFAMPFAMQLAMYATPIVYPLSLIPEKWRPLALLNPMTPVVEIFRKIFLGVGTVDLSMVINSGIATIIILLVGIVMFNKVEKSFMDTV